ncbi:hypothetical protein BC939DRAFT_478143 [Gamsiella multidivaricata]|uniref:uncharacterized protein n=1 Tax=Gamsiella multidivaricata TaxID=101098 RepID=UPI00221F3980|nr:uncharacterized protein BC939DRAFT_478143 [Gamsiella multidivaricata]KAG0365327.1 hypothetical protein BGZ54_006650 [Gamsiella multidivaricata]KAI7821676.1 hypothetical protein BC939DRAFT_478143 [Gamsiella multidivaricata]
MTKRPRTTEHVAAAFVLSLALSTPTHAQQQPNATTTTSTTTPTSTSAPPAQYTNGAPNAFIGVASATGNGRIFYQGGQLNTATVQYSNELLSLDVTVSWPISNPAWSNLTTPTSGAGGPKVSSHSATMSKDLNTLYLTAPTGELENPFLYEYNVKTATWSTENAPSAQAAIWTSRKEAQLLTDPATGAIWYLGGALPGGIDINEIDRYQNGSWNANIAATSVNEGATGSVAVMNKFSSGTSHIYGSRIYLFGGFTSGSGSRSYQSFQAVPWIDISTATPTIGTMLTLGPVPAPRQEHCSVLTSSQKIIIFGGYDANTKSTFDDIWSLDLVTATWQQIITINPTRPRYGHNCNLVGANMIVYGGRASASGSTTEIGYLKDIQVYDVIKTAWMTTYTPKEDLTPISKPLPGGVGFGGTDSSSGLSTGALVGIIVGAIAVVGSIIAVVVYRKRQRRIEIREAEMEKTAYVTSLGSDGEADDELHRDSSRGRLRDGHRSYRNNPYAASSASPRSGSTRPLNGADSTVANTPGMRQYDQAGVETLTPTSQGLKYTSPPESSGGVQYLMQQLPDGTIAVQPVYLDHQPVPLQHSPNMVYSETSSLGGFLGTPKFSSTVPISGAGVAAGMGGQSSPNAGTGYLPPPLSPIHAHNRATSSSFTLPPSTKDNTSNMGNIAIPPPTHDPFA